MRAFVIASIALIAVPCRLAAQTPQTPAAPQPVPPQYKLQVTNHAYMPDGTTSTAVGEGWALQFGQPLRLSVVTGQNACEISSPERVEGAKDVRLIQTHQLFVTDRKFASTQPGLRTFKRLPAVNAAGSGWQVEVVPVREQDGALVLTVTSTRVWTRGYFPADVQRLVQTLTLKPGGHVVVDRVPVSPVAGCDAIGLGLDIGLKPATESTVVETELWLVQRQADGSEKSERQVVRSKLGEPVHYYFPRAFGDMNVSGAVVPKTTRDSKVQLSLTIAREAPDASADWKFRAASATYPLSVGPEEVPSFPLSATRISQSGTPFSLRLRSRVLR